MDLEWWVSLAEAIASVVGVLALGVAIGRGIRWWEAQGPHTLRRLVISLVLGSA